MKISPLVVLACLAVTTPAAAESLGEKTGANSMLGVAPKTADFVSEAAASDFFEIQSSQLASSKTSGNVKTFANEMVADHTKTSSELKPLAEQVNAPAPANMSSSQQGMLKKLQVAGRS